MADDDRLTELTRRRKQAHARLVKLKSRVYDAFLKMEEATVSARFALDVMADVFGGL